MADILQQMFVKVHSSSFSTTVCPHGWNNFAAVEWIFITTDYF
jgi:hypothetical protein